MAKKISYEPHRKLGTKIVPSKTDYDRKDARSAFEDEIEYLLEVENDHAVIPQDMEDFRFHVINPLDF